MNQMVEEGLGVLINKIDVGIYIIKNYEIEFANEQFLKMVGYPLKELLGKECVSLAAQDEKNRLQKIKTEHARMGTYPRMIEFWIVTKEGDRKFIRNRYHLIKEEEGVDFRLTVNDTKNTEHVYRGILSGIR